MKVASVKFAARFGALLLTAATLPLAAQASAADGAISVAGAEKKSPSPWNRWPRAQKAPTTPARAAGAMAPAAEAAPAGATPNSDALIAAKGKDNSAPDTDSSDGGNGSGSGGSGGSGGSK